MIASEARFTPDSKLYRPPAHFFRGSLGRFATGVAVVAFDPADPADPTDTYDPADPANTANTGGGAVHRGITVNSFTSVSMDPPLVLVSIQRAARSNDLLRGRPFTVNILGAEQRALALNFAGRPSPEGAPVWVEGAYAPRLAGVLSWIECTPWAEYDGGDHTLFLGEVREFDYRDGDALGFVNGRFCTIHETVQGHESLF